MGYLFETLLEETSPKWDHKNGCSCYLHKQLQKTVTLANMGYLFQALLEETSPKGDYSNGCSCYLHMSPFAAKAA